MRFLDCSHFSHIIIIPFCVHLSSWFVLSPPLFMLIKFTMIFDINDLNRFRKPYIRSHSFNNSSQRYTHIENVVATTLIRCTWKTDLTDTYYSVRERKQTAQVFVWSFIRFDVSVCKMCFLYGICGFIFGSFRFSLSTLLVYSKSRR